MKRIGTDEPNVLMAARKAVLGRLKRLGLAEPDKSSDVQSWTAYQELVRRLSLALAGGHCVKFQAFPHGMKFNVLRMKE